MQSESARMSSAAEARFRINAPNSKPRAVKVVALDAPSEAVVKRLAEGQWQSATFLTALKFDGAPRGGEGWSMKAWLSDVAGRTKDLIDRAAQKAGRTFSGVEGIAMQDASLQESMGPIVDRTKENLVSTDNGIIMARHRLLRAVKALVDKGIVPPGVDPAHQKVRSAAIVLPPDVPFTEGARDALIARPAVAPASV